MKGFDFIVVGGSPSAVTMAHRLSSSSSRPSVLHLQAGHGQRPDGTAPAVDPCSWSQPLMSTPQVHLGGRTLSLAAGYALGGASTSEAYLDAWADSVGDASYRDSGKAARSEPQHVFAGHTKLPNLTVDCLSQPDKIIFDGKKAIGLSTSNGTVHASKEIVLCAGALRTPQLLLLSGIGPRDHLAALGIPLVCDLPIGKALKDSLVIPVLWEVGPALTGSADWLFDPETMRAHIRQFLNLETNLGKDNPSPLPIVSGQSDAVLDSKDVPALPPRSQDFVRHPATSHWEFCVPPTGGSPNTSQRLLQINAYPQVVCSTGSLQLASKDAAEPPLVDPNYLSQAIDRHNAVDAVRIVTRFFTVLASLSNDMLGPHSAPASDEEADVLAFIRESAATARHYSGATPMGRRQDEEACVDGDFCVLGVAGLRVADISVTPLLPVICSQGTPNVLGSILVERLIKKHNLEEAGPLGA